MLPSAIPGLPGRPRLPPSARACLGGVSPLGVWRPARVLRAQAAARPEDRPAWLEREPAAVSFWPGHGPARAKTAPGPAEFPQGAFRQKPAPRVTGRSRLRALLRAPVCPAGRPFASSLPGNHALRPPRRTGLPAHARWPVAQRPRSFALSARVSRMPQWLRASEIPGSPQQICLRRPGGRPPHPIRPPLRGLFATPLPLVCPGLCCSCAFAAGTRPPRRDPGRLRASPFREADPPDLARLAKTGPARPAAPRNRPRSASASAPASPRPCPLNFPPRTSRDGAPSLVPPPRRARARRPVPTVSPDSSPASGSSSTMPDPLGVSRWSLPVLRVPPRMSRLAGPAQGSGPLARNPAQACSKGRLPEPPFPSGPKETPCRLPMARGPEPPAGALPSTRPRPGAARPCRRGACREPTPNTPGRYGWAHRQEWRTSAPDLSPRRTAFPLPRWPNRPRAQFAPLGPPWPGPPCSLPRQPSHARGTTPDWPRPLSLAPGRSQPTLSVVLHISS